MYAKIGNLSVFGATIALCLMVAAKSHAVPLFDVEFTADSVGNPPNTSPPNAGGLSTAPTFLVASASGNSALVQNTYTDSLTGNTFGTGNVVVLTDTNTAGANAVLFQGAAADETSTGVHTISFDWLEDKGIAATSSFFIGLTNQPRSQNLSAIFLDLGEDVGNIRSANSVNFGATLGTVARGIAHHMDWVIDLDQANLAIATEVYVDGVLLAVQQRDPIGVPHDGAAAFGNLQISSAAAAVGVVALDNIEIQAGRHVVPEPGAIILIGTASVILSALRLKRGRRSQAT